jgi:hypothetical protein
VDDLYAAPEALTIPAVAVIPAGKPVTAVLVEPTVAGIVNEISVTPELMAPGIDGVAVVAAETIRVLP